MSEVSNSPEDPMDLAQTEADVNANSLLNQLAKNLKEMPDQFSSILSSIFQIKK